MKASKQPSLHRRIVREILPRFAERLKKEAIITAYDRKPFTISIAKDWPPITINPDAVVYLPNGERVLIEIANPRDPKRFLGELIYPHILGYLKKITKVIVFVMHDREHQEIHDRGFSQWMVLHYIFKELIPGGTSPSWPRDEETAYHNLKYILKRFGEGKLFRSHVF